MRGFTRHPSSGVGEKTRGTYAGLIEKIPYLKQLGITAVELLPVFQFDAQDVPAGKMNYWGYAPISFFAPHQAYSSRQDSLGPVNEFRDMVKALHRAGIEVILDVVFNHTAEGNECGPTLCFRGIDNPTYYMLEEGGSRYANYTGCGNTLNANHPIVRRMIVDSLRYWVEEMHVDGFRFDLASILRAIHPGIRYPILRCCGTSNQTPHWPARNSLPRPGTQPGFTKWGALWGMPGKSGMADFVMMCGISSVASLVRFDAWQTGLWGAQRFTVTNSAKQSKASTS